MDSSFLHLLKHDRIDHGLICVTGITPRLHQETSYKLAAVGFSKPLVYRDIIKLTLYRFEFFHGILPPIFSKVDRPAFSIPFRAYSLAPQEVFLQVGKEEIFRPTEFTFAVNHSVGRNIIPRKIHFQAIANLSGIIRLASKQGNLAVGCNAACRDLQTNPAHSDIEIIVCFHSAVPFVGTKSPVISAFSSLSSLVFFPMPPA